VDRIPVAGPSITAREIAYVTDAVTNAWYGQANVWHERFERAFGSYVGRRHAIALPSCTSGLHLALAALGVGPGDEVIVPQVTWIATAAPIAYVGATPVFVDVDPVTWCLSAEAFEAAITPRTRAAIPVDLYGGTPDWAALERIAACHGVVLVEDAAEAIGAERDGRRAGGFGRCSVFSFHGSKTLTTGEGGMLVTDDDALAQRALFLRDHGRTPGDTMFRNAEVGFKYKMSAMQAALGVAQIERVEELVSRKREIFGWYRACLGDVPGLRLNAEPPGTRNAYWMTSVLFESPRMDKVSVLKALSAAGIDARPFFSALGRIPAYASELGNARSEPSPVADAIGEIGVNLPSALSLTRAQVERVCDVVTALARVSAAA
jgi:perosamine synthetase